MALQLGPVIGTVGGATWDETPVAATNVGRNEARTLMTVTPPPPESVVVLVVGDAQTSIGGTPTMWIGDHDAPVAIGRSATVHVLSSAGTVRFQGPNNIGSVSSFTGTVYTMPFPG